MHFILRLSSERKKRKRREEGKRDSSFVDAVNHIPWSTKDMRENSIFSDQEEEDKKKRRDIKCPFFSICASLSLIAILFHSNPISSYVLYNKKTLLHRLTRLSFDSKVSSKEWLWVRKRDQDTLKNNFCCWEEGVRVKSWGRQRNDWAGMSCLFHEDCWFTAPRMMMRRRLILSSTFLIEKEKKEMKQRQRKREKKEAGGEWPPMTVSLSS